MTPAFLPGPLDPSFPFTDQLTALHAETEAMLRAMANNALAELEESLWRQQVLCATLQRAVEEQRLSEQELASVRDRVTRLRGPQQQLSEALVLAAQSISVLQRLHVRYDQSQAGSAVASWTGRA